MKHCICVSLLLMCGSAFAVPVKWTLNNGLMDDGGVVSGSFVYDADTGEFSSVALSSTAGSSLDGADYVVGHNKQFGPAGGYFDFGATPGEYGPALTIAVYGILTNEPKVFSLDVTEGLCAYDEGCSRGTYSRSLSGPATLTGQTVPLPSAVWLFISGLGLLVRARRNGCA